MMSQMGMQKGTAVSFMTAGLGLSFHPQLFSSDFACANEVSAGKPASLTLRRFKASTCHGEVRTNEAGSIRIEYRNCQPFTDNGCLASAFVSGLYYNRTTAVFSVN